MSKYFDAQIIEGSLIMEDKKQFLRSIKHMDDGEYIVSIFKQIQGTSRDMQKLYFAILGEWSNDTGWKKDELHSLVKNELFPELFESTSTASLTQHEWTLLVREVEDFLIIKFENK
jgi:hypothetical protein